ncbi:MAG: nucleotidyltransferase domain-containing protein [Elainellaceae cyanobacterium]
MLSKTNIQEIANKVAECFSPEKIILFGSYARGDVHDNSDLDLLVVMNSESPLGKRSAPIIG